GWTEVFLVDHAVVTDDEGLDAGLAVFSGRRDQCEATNHQALDDELHLTERRRRSLTFQHFEVVAVVRLTLAVALLDRNSNLFADGAAPGAVTLLPREAIFRPRRADDVLRVLIHVVPLARLQ